MIEVGAGDVAQHTIGGVTYTVVKNGSELPGGYRQNVPSDLVMVGVVDAVDPDDDQVEYLYLPIGARPADITAQHLLDGWLIRIHGLAHQDLPIDNPYAEMLLLVSERDTEQELCDWCQENAVRIFVERLGLGEVL